MKSNTVFRILPPFRCGDDDTLAAWQRRAAEAAARQVVPYAVSPSVHLPHPSKRDTFLKPGDAVRRDWYSNPGEFDRLLQNGSILESTASNHPPEAA